MLNPKQRYLTDNARVAAHDSWVHTEAVLDSIQTALAQMACDFPHAENPSRAWDCHSRLTGALEFIRIWLNLAERPVPTRKLPVDHLNP